MLDLLQSRRAYLHAILPLWYVQYLRAWVVLRLAGGVSADNDDRVSGVDGAWSRVVIDNVHLISTLAATKQIENLTVVVAVVAFVSVANAAGVGVVVVVVVFRGVRVVAVLASGSPSLYDVAFIMDIIIVFKFEDALYSCGFWEQNKQCAGS